MHNTLRLFALLLFVGSITLLASCDRNKKKCEGSFGIFYNFDIPFTITPMQDTFAVGDTLWLHFEFGNQMLNKANGKTYTVNNFEFKMYGYILDLKTNTVMPTNDFTLINKDTQIDVNGDRNGAFYHINTQMEDGIYSWKAGIIMKKPGLYAAMNSTEIGNDGLLAGQSPSQRITECPKEEMSLDFTLTNGSGNSYFLDDAADENPRERWDRPAFDKVNFAFYVKE